MGTTDEQPEASADGQVLNDAHRLGLRVIAGLWLEPPRRGFDYRNRAAVDAQLKAIAATVERHKRHPALLMWGIGNEVEAELADDAVVWPAIEQAARLVKSLDPAHPAMAVLAEAGGDKVRRLAARAPSIDVLGVNAYGEGLLSMPDRVRAQGWTGPIVVSELGALGQWQAGRTAWGAALEPSSTAKADALRRYVPAIASKTAGYLLFLWGHKQEVTPTWHSLLLESGEWTEAAEAMAQLWQGRTPGGNRAPRIVRLATDPAPGWRPSEAGRATLEASDPDGDAVAVEWTLLAESTDLKLGGDAEGRPAEFPRAVRRVDARQVAISGLAPGNYRIFATVRDGKGAAATANVPFRVGE
jgi:Glycosyl hydrolases family 2, TIM barrel domain